MDNPQQKRVKQQQGGGGDVDRLSSLRQSVLAVPLSNQLVYHRGSLRMNMFLISIKAHILKSLTIKNLNTSTLLPTVELHTPKLVWFCYHDVGKVIDFSVINLPILERAEVRLSLSKREVKFYYPSFCKLSRGISNADSYDLLVPEEYIAVHAGIRAKAKLGD